MAPRECGKRNGPEPEPRAKTVFQNPAGGVMIARHESTTCSGRPLGSHRTVTSEGAAQAEGWTAPCHRPRCPERHHLRAAHWLPLALVAYGTLLRQRHDVLAAAARLAGSRR